MLELLLIYLLENNEYIWYLFEYSIVHGEKQINSCSGWLPEESYNEISMYTLIFISPEWNLRMKEFILAHTLKAHSLQLILMGMSCVLKKLRGNLCHSLHSQESSDR